MKSDLPFLKVPQKSDVKKYLKNSVKVNKSSTPKAQVTSIGVSATEAIRIVDTFDRPGDSSASATYSRSGTYAEAFTNEPGKRIPKAGAFAEAGVGEAKAEWSVFEASAKGPNASACAKASALGVKAMATAGLGTASASAGPLAVKVGLSLDTGVSAGVDGVEAKIAGTGFSVGPKTSASVLSTGVSCCIS